MKWLLLTVLVLLQGCSTQLNLRNYTLQENQNFHQPAGKANMIVRWLTVSDERLQAICAAVTDKIYAGKVFLGCTGKTSGGTCVIHTSTDTTHQILGHELRHCFQGNFHKDDK